MKKARNIAFVVAVFLVIGCIVIAFATNIFTSVSVEADSNENVFTDPRDGKTYKAVKISEQTWMAENLNYEVEGSKCHSNDPANCEKYGRLYTWETALKVCPEGWHLPTYKEWDELMAAVGGEDTAGKKLKAKKGWSDDKGKSGNGEDTYGFAALPGSGGGMDGGFGSIGKYGDWWSATEDYDHYAYSYSMSNGESAYLSSYRKGFLHSVRCVEGLPVNEEDTASVEADSSENAFAETFTDRRDGRAYKYVTIGEQTWLAENLNYKAEGSVCYNNDPANCEIYGRLYKESAAKACPKGWHLPVYEEWEKLIDYIGSKEIEDWDERVYSPGGKNIVSKHLKAKKGWRDYYGKSGNGEDTYGFAALPGGMYIDGGICWDTDTYGECYYDGFQKLYVIGAWHNFNSISRQNTFIPTYTVEEDKLYVRCVRDLP